LPPVQNSSQFPQTWTAKYELFLSLSQSSSHFKVKVTLRLTVSQSVSLGVESHLGLTLWLLRSWFCGAPSLTSRRVCLLCMLLGLASVVFLWSESLGICGHILLSQIWDVPFSFGLGSSPSNRGADRTENNAFNGSSIVVGVCTDPLPRNNRSLIRLLHSNGCTRYSIKTCNIEFLYNP
jgi:hypothetical protein